ncbi:MAG: NrsF family protein [Burkholderiaceae bacterium]
MKTDDLIDLLARDTVAVRPAAIGARFGVGLAVSAPIAAAVMLYGLGFGLRPDLGASLMTPSDWPKYLMVTTLLAAGWFACARLARPGAPLRGVRTAVLAPIAALVALAAAMLANAAPDERMVMVMGSTWRTCAVSIAIVAAPVFAAAVLTMRGLAPTRLRAAGAAAGLFAGAAGASIYALHCPESEAPFLVVWYGLGIALPAVLGALVGPRLLRW